MTFREQFPAINDKQYEQVVKIAARAKEAVASQESNVQKDPSFIWENVHLLNYALTPSRELANVWRLHNQMFTGNNMAAPIESRYHALPKSLLKKYRLRTRGIPDELICRPPRILGECGWDINGGIVNDDIIMYQRHVNTLYVHGILDRLKQLEHPVIVEIGGGYGGLAYFLKRILPRATYYMVDLAEALVFPAVYLQVTLPEYVDETSFGEDAAKKDIRFVSSTDIHRISGPVDLVINTGSFGEMTVPQIDDYAKFVSDKDALLYEENQNTTVPVSTTLGNWFTQKPAEGLQRFWAGQARTFDLYHDRRTVRIKLTEWASRTVRKFPFIKKIVKRLLISR